MTKLGAEFKSSGITKDTPKNVLFGAGTVHKGLKFVATYALTADETAQDGKTYYTKTGESYVVAEISTGEPTTGGTYYEKTGGAWNFEDSLICATSGGSSLSIAPEYVDIEIDGALVKIKDLKKKTGETATMTIHPAELKSDILKMALIATDQKATDAEGYNVIESKADIETGDYLENIAFVGKRLDGTPIIVVMDNALCTSGLELEVANKEGSFPELVFECHAELTPEADKLPYHIYYPTPTEQS